MKQNVQKTKINEVLQLNLRSGLVSSVSIHMARSMAVNLINGWGWYFRNDGTSTEVDHALFYDKILTFRACGLLIHSGMARGVYGDIEEEHQEVFGAKLLAVSMSDGLNYDFDKELCSAWRLFIGEFDYELSDQAELNLSGSGFLGWGRNLHLIQ